MRRSALDDTDAALFVTKWRRWRVVTSVMVTRSVGFSALLLLLFVAPVSGRIVGARYPENLSPDTYLPGQHVVLTVADPPASLAKVYALPLSRAIAYFRNTRDPAMLTGLSPVRSGSFQALPGGRTQSLDAGSLPVGYYAVSVGDGNMQLCWMFSVSSFGLATVGAGTSAVWAVDLSTFDHLKQPVSMWVYGQHGERRLAVDADAIAFDTAENGDGGGMVMASAADGSYQIVGEVGSGMAEGGTLVSTDRPIYRPGQTVNIRAILRDGGVDAYTIPHGQVRLKVSSNDGNRALAERMLRISPFGTVSTSVRLPHDVPIGVYEVSVGPKRPNGYFSVVAYKKPEFTLHVATARPWTIAGDPTTVRVTAKYLFGRPATGLRLHYAMTLLGTYRATVSGWLLPFDQLIASNASESTLDVVTGDATTNAAGEFDLPFAAPVVDRARPIEISVRATDASGRTVSTALALTDHPAAFSVDVQPARWFAAVGQEDDVAIRTRSHDGGIFPSQTLTLTVERLQWNARERRYETTDRQVQTLVTDAAGSATFAWVPPVAATYKFALQGTDEHGRVATASAFTVAATAESAGDNALPDRWLRLVPEKTTLAPGEHARVLVMAPVANRDALVAVCTDRLVRLRLVHISGTAAVIDEAPPPNAAKFSVSVLQGGESGGLSGIARLSVDPPPRRLVVRIVPSKRRYEPGETAGLRIDVRDSAGRPARAEVGIGVVDEAIYALQEERQSPFDAFYGYAPGPFAIGQWNMTVQPYRNFTLRTIANVSARAAMPPPTASASSDSASVRVRQNFLDTAFWAPSVLTDERGHAEVSFPWPDDLTTWRATGTAVTTATGIGTGTADALVTKDFLVRLATPRFLRLGDRSTLTGIAQGVTAAPAVTLRLEADALAPQATLQRVWLDVNATGNASWPVYAAQIGTFPATLYGSDVRRRDAMRTSLAVEGATPEEHVVASGSGSGSARMAVPPGYGAGAVTVTLSPSVLAQLVQSLRLLQVYPYYCTEQTLSAALPALYVERALRRANATSFYDLRTRDVIVKALARLYQLRHLDGSYGWWEHDAAHPFMTAYALYALAEFGKAGYFVGTGPTVDSLVEQLQASNDDTLRFWGGRQPGSEWNTRAFMLFALADAAPERVDPTMLADARAHAPAMNAYALAVLGLAERLVGDDASARELLRMLDARVVDNGRLAYWPGQTWDYAWEDDPIETTAYALRLQTALEPESPLIPRVVAFLRGQMRGGWAYTTKDTAATIYALSDALPADPNELNPNETVRVTVDGRTVRSLHVTQPILDAADAEVVIPAGEVRNGSVVGVVRSGGGALYWATDFTRYVPPAARAVVDKQTPLLERLFPPQPEVTISRRYVPEQAGPWRVGERIAVEITVTSRRDLQYVAIDDPFPAGAEHPIDQGTAAEYNWSGLQFLDDRATFFADRLDAGETLVLRYALDLTTPGEYTAPATIVSSMYGPPLKALGEPEKVTIAAP